MFNHLKSVFILLAMLLSFSCYGQVDDNIPLGAMPMQFNSSFAGEADDLRLTSVLSYRGYGNRDNKTDIYQATSYHAAIDRFIPEIRSGLGLTVSRYSQTFQARLSPDEDFITDSKKDIFEMMVAIAPKFSIKGKYTLSPSVDFGYSRDDIKHKISPQYRIINHRLQSRIGLLFNTKKMYISYAVYLVRHNWHTNVRPLYLPSGFSSFLQTGYTFQRAADSKFSFTPQVMFYLDKRDLRNGRITILPNFTFRYMWFMAGLNHTGIHVGFQNDKLRIMLSSIAWGPDAPWGWDGNDKGGPFSSGNMAVRHIF